LQLCGETSGFDPNEAQIIDTAPRIRTKNLGNLIGLDAVDLGQTPTQWQRSLYPAKYQAMMQVTHEGIDTNIVKPDANSRLCLDAADIELTLDDEVVTYVAPNLEPYRGFDSFMRSLPAILEQRPHAHVLVAGGDEISYGHRLPNGQTHRQRMLAELGSSLDLKRVHFLGKVPYPTFLKILQVSRVHVYLTFLFVLSWSMLETMSAGCLLVASKTAPVEEVIRDGENGFLVDFFSTAE
jgi:glycosyltransferase involved in cell wall biosynthesis